MKRNLDSAPLVFPAVIGEKIKIKIMSKSKSWR
jgi:hypothetical protein